ncbi:MAG: hypothetical protein ACREK8_10725 [Gemmatimonadales bacterium]
MKAKHRSVAEIAFKHSTRHMEDGGRTLAEIRGAMGKKLANRSRAAL